MEEESKGTAVGRRDLFRIPGETPRNGAGAGRGVVRNAPGRPPLQNRRPAQTRPIEEEKKAPSGLSQGGFVGDFNLAGTQIGGLGGTPQT